MVEIPGTSLVRRWQKALGAALHTDGTSRLLPHAPPATPPSPTGHQATSSPQRGPGEGLTASLFFPASAILPGSWRLPTSLPMCHSHSSNAAAILLFSSHALRGSIRSWGFTRLCSQRARPALPAVSQGSGVCLESLCRPHVAAWVWPAGCKSSRGSATGGAPGPLQPPCPVTAGGTGLGPQGGPA